MTDQWTNKADIRATGPADLARQVFDRNRCAVCGACVGVCPYYGYHEGRVVRKDACTLAQGRCWTFCPMAGAKGRFEGELGDYERILIARGADPTLKKKAQYGGVVTALTVLALNEGIIDEAILASGHPESPPHGVRASTRAQVLASSGSRFAMAGILTELNRALSEPVDTPLGVVGTPCQIKSAAAMRATDPARVPFNPRKIKLLIGLFCTWALDYRRLAGYLRFMLMGERAIRYDIPPPPSSVLQVWTGDGLKAFPLEEVKIMRLEACRFCDDLTAVRSDLSVGAIHGLEGWNTLIVRTETGRNLVDLAVEKGLIELDRYPEEDLENLKDAARQKKERAIVAWRSED